LWFRAIHPRPDLRPAPTLRTNTGPWARPPRRRPSQTGADEFSFLNETRTLSQHGWDDAALSKLWRYNLHYFDGLNAAGAAERVGWHRALIERWIAENPPGKGTGWEPYPTSLRIVNWIKWALAGNELTPEAIQSLAIQTRWLTRRLEHHLLGNHFFANAKALVFAGCFFDGEEAKGWLELGLRILREQVPEQILADGGHFELSTMYHALALEDMLDLVNVMRAAGLAPPASWDNKIATMRDWLAAMCHPDGEIAFFNDAAIGIAPSPAELDAYAQRLGYPALAPPSTGCRHFPDSGYIRLADGRAMALLDVARIAPDYLPGHAHADTLSFELSVKGRRVLVNSGTSVYGSGPERQRQRGTGAHNTVEIDNENSSEVWAGFRVARRAHPQGLSVMEEEGWRVVACGHDGYAWLPGKPRHRRTWRFGKERLIVGDNIEGRHGSAVAAFHFHPALTPSADTDALAGALVCVHETVLRWRVMKGSARIEPSTWHPEFGKRLASHRLLVTLSEGEGIVEFSWANA
jgi:uncharacterized heparinase superfamily protein